MSVDLPCKYQRAVLSQLSPCDLIVIYSAGLGFVPHQTGQVQPDTDPFPIHPSSISSCPCSESQGPVCGKSQGAQGGGGLEPTGVTEPTRRFRQTFSHTDHIQFVRFIIAWA